MNRDARVERRILLAGKHCAQRKPCRSRERHGPWPYVESKANRIERCGCGVSRKHRAIVDKNKRLEIVGCRAEIMVQLDIGVDAAVARNSTDDITENGTGAANLKQEIGREKCLGCILPGGVQLQIRATAQLPHGI